MAKQPWQNKEKSDAVDFGARQTPRSGGLWFAKGDSRNEKYLIDSKDSHHSQFIVTSKIWQKVNREALLSSRIPLLSIGLENKKIELVIIDKNDFLELVKGGEKDG